MIRNTQGFKRMFLCAALLLAMPMLLAGCRKLESGLNLHYWESGIWPSRQGNVVIKYLASREIERYYETYCADIENVLARGRCIGRVILDSVLGDDQAALIVRAGAEPAALGDQYEAEDLVAAVEEMIDRDGRQCLHLKTNGFSSNAINWSVRNHGDDNCSDGHPWEYGVQDECPNCIPAPSYAFKHDFSLTPQPSRNPTNSCVRAENVYLCRLVESNLHGLAYIVPDNREFQGSTTVSTSDYMGSAYGYAVKKKDGSTFEGCTRVNIGYRNYEYRCAYKTSNHWERKVNSSTWRVYFSAARNTWKTASCGLELGKALRRDASANPQTMAEKCGGIDW